MAAGRDSLGLAAYYGELLAEQEGSGLSVTEFAEEAGVSAATLYAWRRRLRGRAGKAKLLEVDVIEGGSEASGSQFVTLEVDERFRIELPGDFDEDALMRLLGVLDRC